MISRFILFLSVTKRLIEEQEMELKRNVFRMVQELLNNAKKYAGAANVRFSLSLEEGVMYLEYMDDGVGFDTAKPVVREIGSNGMGIRQMKTRIMAMGGQLRTAL
jgi:two-component system sensor histidine kinase ComP